MQGMSIPSPAWLDISPGEPQIASIADKRGHRAERSIDIMEQQSEHCILLARVIGSEQDVSQNRPVSLPWDISTETINVVFVF